MRHKSVINEIEEFVFLGIPLRSETIRHIDQCVDCKNYYEKASKFNQGLNKLKHVSSKVSGEFSFDVKRFSLSFEKKRISYFSFLFTVRRIKRILMSFSIVLLLLISSFLLSFVFQSYLFNETDKIAESVSTMLYDTIYSNFEQGEDEDFLENW